MLKKQTGVFKKMVSDGIISVLLTHQVDPEELPVEEPGCPGAPVRPAPLRIAIDTASDVLVS